MLGLGVERGKVKGLGLVWVVDKVSSLEVVDQVGSIEGEVADKDCCDVSGVAAALEHVEEVTEAWVNETASSLGSILEFLEEFVDVEKVEEDCVQVEVIEEVSKANCSRIIVLLLLLLLLFRREALSSNFEFFLSNFLTSFSNLFLSCLNLLDTSFNLALVSTRLHIFCSKL